jgi:hypothetical protein
VKLQFYHRKSIELCEKIIERDNNNAKLPMNYYRVAFYGKSIGSKDNESIVDEFIYRESPQKRVHQLVESLRVRKF